MNRVVKAILLFSFLLIQPLFAQFLPGVSHFERDLMQPTQRLLEGFTGQAQVVSAGITPTKACREFIFRNRRGELAKVISQCVQLINIPEEGLSRERVVFSSEGRIITFFEKRLEVSGLERRASLEELFSLRFSEGSGLLRTGESYELVVRYQNTNRGFESVLLKSLQVNFRLEYFKEMAGDRVRTTYQRTCPWCSIPSQVEVLEDAKSLQYYSDAFPSTPVTPRQFREDLSQIYSQSLVWFAQSLRETLESEVRNLR